MPRVLIVNVCAAGALALALCACSSNSPEQPIDYPAETVRAMHDSISADLATLIVAATDLQHAAPAPVGRGWDGALDAAAIADMRQRWVAARVAYEHVEGALAPLFPDIDQAIDFRYEDFLFYFGPDDDLFDAGGVTGLHAAERVIYADVIPANVVAFEEALIGYKAASFPATEAEATRFRTALLGRIVSDAQSLQAQWTPANIDLPGCFTGLVDLMSEQREKVNKAGNQEEESRYSQRTMADLRANLEGTRTIFAKFEPWLRTVTSPDPEADGPTLADAVEAGFDALDAVYATVQGDAFPAPPPTWSSENPSASDLATPFGQLFSAVSHAVDPNEPGSIVDRMNRVASVLHIVP